MQNSEKAVLKIKSKQKLQIQISDQQPQKFQQDERIRSKCTTPKKLTNVYQRNKKQSKNKNKQKEQRLGEDKLFVKNQGSNQKTEVKGYREKGEPLRESRRQAGDIQNLEFQTIMEQKIHGYEVVAGTLRQYIKQKSMNGKKHKYLPTVISIIKAYTKSQIAQISPNVAQLIKKILNTLPLPQPHKKPQPPSKPISPSPSPYPIASSSQKGQKLFKKQRTLKTQINDLQQSLQDLKQQYQILESMQHQFEEMEYDQKLKYISELEEVVQKQKSILATL